MNRHKFKVVGQCMIPGVVEQLKYTANANGNFAWYGIAGGMQMSRNIVYGGLLLGLVSTFKGGVILGLCSVGICSLGVRGMYKYANYFPEKKD